MYTLRRALVVLGVLGVILGPLTLPGHAAPATRTHRLPDGRFYVAHHPGRPASAAVVVLHSLGHDWREGPAQGWSALADAKGFLAVYPNSAGSWNAGLCCGAATDPTRFPASSRTQVAGRDDVGFLAKVIGDVRARYRPRSVYVVGWSNGGMMAERLVAERPWLSGRLAVWGSAPEMPFPGYWTGRAWLGHGALDTTVPWQGTPLAPWCACQIRPGQATPRYLVGAHLEAHVHTGLGHAPPSWWPAAAWRALSAS